MRILLKKTYTLNNENQTGPGATARGLGRRQRVDVKTHKRSRDF